MILCVYRPKGYEDGTIRVGVRWLNWCAEVGGVDSRLGMDLFLHRNVQIVSGAHPASCSMCTGDKAKREVRNEWSCTSTPSPTFFHIVGRDNLTPFLSFIRPSCEFVYVHWLYELSLTASDSICQFLEPHGGVSLYSSQFASFEWIHIFCLSPYFILALTVSFLCCDSGGARH